MQTVSPLALCGHPIPAPPPDQEWRLSRPCTACWLARRREINAAAERKAARQIARGVLPALKGTAAQLPWAQRERLRLLCGLDRIARGSPSATRRRNAEIVRNWAEGQLAASFWIDLHREGPTGVLQRYYREALKAYSNLNMQTRKVA